MPYDFMTRTWSPRRGVRSIGDDEAADAHGPKKGERISAMDGTIKMVNQGKGWGFIRATNGEEVFFHRSVVRGKVFELVEPGQGVTFTKGDTRPGKGPRADLVEFS